MLRRRPSVPNKSLTDFQTAQKKKKKKKNKKEKKLRSALQQQQQQQQTPATTKAIGFGHTFGISSRPPAPRQQVNTRGPALMARSG